MDGWMEFIIVMQYSLSCYSWNGLKFTFKCFSLCLSQSLTRLLSHDPDLFLLVSITSFSSALEKKVFAGTLQEIWVKGKHLFGCPAINGHRNDLQAAD